MVLSPQWLAFFLSVIAVIIAPSIALTLRATIRWTRVESQLNTLSGDIKELVENKDKTHTEMMTVIREDRATADKRLRWLEEYLWKRGNNAVRNQGN